MPKPSEKLGIGFDQIPTLIRNSKVLTGNDLGRLANVERLPDQCDIVEVKGSPEFNSAKTAGEAAVHILAQNYLRVGRVEEAWKVLLAF